MIQSKLAKIYKTKNRLKIIVLLYLVTLRCLVFADYKTNKLGIALGYSTHEICSCIFIEKRAASECQTDYGLTTTPVKLEVDINSKLVVEKFFHPATGDLVLKRWARLENNSCLLDSAPNP